MSACRHITEKALALLLSKLKHLESVVAIATNIGVVAESELSCRLMLRGCPLVLPPLAAYDTIMDGALKKNQNVSKRPEDSLTTKNSQYFRG